MIKTYSERKEHYQKLVSKLEKQSRTIGMLRLAFALGMIVTLFYWISNVNLIFIGLTILFLVAFIFLFFRHQSISWKKKLTRTLLQINDNEINHLNGNSNAFPEGSEYHDAKHFYSLDLDVFGTNSLFQNLNRTATYIGGKKLADKLLNLLPAETIPLNQQAIQELSGDYEWRQNLLALATLIDDKEKNYNDLVEWSDRPSKPFSRFEKVMLYVLPSVTVLLAVAYLTLPISNLFTYLSGVFIFNLFVTSRYIKRIKREIFDFDKIGEVIRHYSLILEEIENRSFTSSKLLALQKSILIDNSKASFQIKRLSKHLSNLQNIQNVIGAFFLNGLLLFHVHSLMKLTKWKDSFSKDINTWLESIGEFEAMNSLANFRFNNADFVFPEISEDPVFDVVDLGHPLIPAENRVCNNVHLDLTNFTILTGSNMSGKSTFLRSIGINMVLGGTGSVICASKAKLHPLKVLVSMRQSDSLNENESYFFAEIKRLKSIIEELGKGPALVLLDEILRGTNSDDKHTGTIKVLENIISHKAIGMLATHDLSVCDMTNDHQGKVVNRCFEAEIINDQLFFDYKLKDGVCRNKNASFLMRKMEIF